jgi:hypothetical protein
VMFSLALIPGLTSLRKASQSPRSIALVTISYELRWSDVELLDATLRLDAHDTASIAAKSHGIMSINRFIRGQYPPNGRTERCGRSTTSESATDVAHPPSLQ